jgi:hypothetical protein
MKIRSPLKGSLSSCYSAKVLLLLIILGKGLPHTAKGGRTAVVLILP